MFETQKIGPTKIFTYQFFVIKMWLSKQWDCKVNTWLKIVFYYRLHA